MRAISLIAILVCVCQFEVEGLKGVWFTVSGSQLAYSPEGIRAVVRKCQSIRIDTIYFSVWDQSLLNYPPPASFRQKYPFVTANPKFGFDPVRVLLDEAHLHGIAVLGWFEYGFAASYLDAQGGPILRARPDWRALDQQGQIVTKNNFQWMNGFLPEVQQFMLDMLHSFVEAYPDIQGIQGDDRLPAMPSLAGYDPYTATLYTQQHQGRPPPTDIYDKEWVDWRCSLLNKFAESIYRTMGGKVQVHMAPSVYPWSKSEYLQEWPTWVTAGWVDTISPQIYRYNISAYSQTLQDALQQIPTAKKRLLIPGMLIGVGSNSTVNAGILEQALQLNEALELAGQSYFYHESLFDARVADIIARH